MCKKFVLYVNKIMQIILRKAGNKMFTPNLLTLTFHSLLLKIDSSCLFIKVKVV